MCFLLILFIVCIFVAYKQFNNPNMREFKKVRVSKTQQKARDFLWLKNTEEGNYKLMMPTGSVFTEIKVEGTVSKEDIESVDTIIEGVDSIFGGGDWTDGNYIMLHLGETQGNAEAGLNFNYNNWDSAYLVDEQMHCLLVGNGGEYEQGQYLTLYEAHAQNEDGTIEISDEPEFFSEELQQLYGRVIGITITCNNGEPESFDITTK